MRKLLYSLLLALLPFYAVADLLGSGAEQNAGQSVLSALDTEDVEFLPVHEAYRASLDLSAEQILVYWDIEPGYYLYGEQFQVDLIDKASGNQFVDISIITEEGVRAYDDYFEREVEKHYVATTLTIEPATALQSENLVLSVRFQGCADAGLCYPPETLHFEINALAGESKPLSQAGNYVANSSVELSQLENSQGKQSLLLMMLFALMGGFILNLMPCVFPVLSIKALSFMSSAHSAKHLQWHSWVYTAGIICSFLVLVLVLMLLRSAGEVVGWGFQLQSPVFIALLVYLFFVLGLSLSGFFTIGSRWVGLGQQLTEGKETKSAFFTGVLAVLVSSPCSVPFMGVALGYALTQSGLETVLVFSALGFGLALPFIVLSHFPALANRLPKPGPWMERLKQFLAFPLYLTVVWLLWVLGHQAGSDAVTLLLAGMVLLVFAIWLYQPASTGGSVSLLSRLLAVAVIVTAFVVPFMGLGQNASAQEKSIVNSDSFWQPYNEETLKRLRTEGKPVFVELTADWCITCLMNEKAALHRDSVMLEMENKGVVYLRGDWTNGDAAITAVLKKFQRGGVPLYLLYLPGKDFPVILPQLLTEDIVLSALQQI